MSTELKTKCSRFSRAKGADALFPFLNIHLLRNLPRSYCVFADSAAKTAGQWNVFFTMTFLEDLKG